MYNKLKVQNFAKQLAKKYAYRREIDMKEFKMKIDKETVLKFSSDNGKCTYINKTKKIVYYTIFDILNEITPPLLTNNKTNMIIVNYEKGIFCYKISNGEILWKIKKRNILDPIIFEKYLVCELLNKEIWILNADNGEKIESLKIGNGSALYKLSEELIFYGTFRNIYYIYDVFKNKFLYSINEKVLNTNKSLAFTITDAKIKNNNLILKGFESNIGDEVKYFDKKIELEKMNKL